MLSRVALPETTYRSCSGSISSPASPTRSRVQDSGECNAWADGLAIAIAAATLIAFAALGIHIASGGAWEQRARSTGGNLSANPGSQALSTGALFGPGSAVWGVVAQLTQPLFNPGLPAQKRAALAAFDATSAHYQGVVRASLRRVADALRSLENDARVLSARAAADESAQTSLTAVDHRYTLGVASFTQLLTAQQQAQQTRIELIADQAQRLIDSVALYQAMGGGVLVDTAVAQSPSAQTPGDVPQR
jgi:hypothetical protein